MNEVDAETFITQWDLANEMLDELEGREKEDLFDFMMWIAINLADLGYSIDSEWQWQKVGADE
jgi:hypothetical protein